MPQLTPAGRPKEGDDPVLQVLTYLYKGVGDMLRQRGIGPETGQEAGRAVGGFMASPPGELLLGKNHEMGMVDWAVPGSGRGLRNLPLFAAALGGRPKMPPMPPRYSNVAPTVGGRPATAAEAEAIRADAARQRQASIEAERVARARDAGLVIPEPTVWQRETATAPRGERLKAELRDIHAQSEAYPAGRLPARRLNKKQQEAEQEAKGILARNQRLVPVEPRNVIIDPTQATEAGERRVATKLGRRGGEAQQAQAVYDWTIARKDTIRRANKFEQTGLASEEEVRRYLRTGMFGQFWYEGADEALTAGIERIRQAARDAHVTLPMRQTESESRVLGRMLAATSPRTEPGQNVDNALKAYFTWMLYGRQEGHQFSRQEAGKKILKKTGEVRPELIPTGGREAPGFFPGQGENLSRIVAGDPIEGMKVSNYLLDIFGSQRAPTVDRWMVELLIPGRTSVAAQIGDWEYQVTADRLTDLATMWGTTPVRLQAALWTGYKLIHDEKMFTMLKSGALPEEVVPSLGTHIKGGIERAVIEMKKHGASWVMKGDPKMLATLPILGLAKTLIEDDNAYTASQAQPTPVAEGPPSGYGLQGPAATRPRME